MKSSTKKISYTRQEELWNSWSHAAGILLGVVFGTIFLGWCIRERNGWAMFGVALYLFGMLGSYVSSTIYHALSPQSRWKERLRRLDHSAIYWHIAGSYSPITLLALWHHGYWGISLFIFVWACAAVGTYFSFFNLKAHNNFETICYVGMGLSVMVAFKPLLAAVPIGTVSWIMAEGVFYIIGAAFYSLHKRKYMHTIFHFFVLAGSVCHIIAVWQMLMQYLYLQ
ncbi:MAG: hemolysin III family protein [Prevotella sp.]|nr:hemolysin III family protein [Prevotella sp.]MDT3388213.1 hemolysin III family protein [Bacteroidota bacterium]